MLRWLFVASLMLIGPVAAWAHTGNGPHGGPVADAGPYYVELIMQGQQLHAYVFDESTSNPVTVKDGKGTATVLVGQQKETLSLAPGGEPNLMAGELKMNAGAGARVVVLIELAGKPPVIARFAL